MNYEELLEYLELEDASEFKYFENVADIVESEETIENEAIHMLIKGADKDSVSQALGDYFEDILNGLPEDSGEIYSLLHQIKISFIGMLSNMADENDLRKFTDEFYNFICWYSEESVVELIGDTDVIHQCLRDAITTARMEKFGGKSYRYNFEGALTYELDDYVFSFAELMAAEEYDDDEGKIVFDPSEGNYS